MCRMNFIVRFRGRAISLTGALHEPAQFARAALDDDAPFVMIDSVGDLARGAIDFSARIFNPAAQSASCEYELFVRPGGMRSSTLTQPGSAPESEGQRAMAVSATYSG